MFKINTQLTSERIKEDATKDDTSLRRHLLTLKPGAGEQPLKSVQTYHYSATSTPDLNNNEIRSLTLISCRDRYSRFYLFIIFSPKLIFMCISSHRV